MTHLAAQGLASRTLQTLAPRRLESVRAEIPVPTGSTCFAQEPVATGNSNWAVI